MKKKAIGIVLVLLALAAGFFMYRVWSAKKAASDAVEAYNAAAADYNEMIAPYNEAAASIADANNKLQGVLDGARAVLDEGKEAYEPDTVDELESAVQKASKAFADVPALIDPFEMRDVPGTFDTQELALLQHEAETSLDAVKEAEEAAPETPEVPDYTEETEAVRTAQKKYEDSIQKLANITSPPDTFVKERLERIGTVVRAEAVTKDYDPNGLLGAEGGYLGCVYFLDERVDRGLLPQEAFSKDKNDAAEDGGEASEDGGTENAAAGTGNPDADSVGDTAAETVVEAAAGAESTAENAAENAAASETAGSETAASGMTAAETAAEGEAPAPKENSIDVVMIGTVGGGAVEVFATEEDAKKRMEYIAFFDGSVMAAGPCEIEGTCLIRVSKYLGEEEQKKLIREIKEALLAVD